MGTEATRWIDAGTRLAKDPSAQVLCPRCARDYLLVEDERNPSDNEELERIMRCKNCGAMNVLRLRRPAM